jgi:molecular chaperone HtpG
MEQHAGHVAIPKPLRDLLIQPVEAEVLRFNNIVSELLSDNKLPFFPNYTDHGVSHVSRVLSAITGQLVPSDVLGCFGANDAAVLICASLLHDLAMHLREDGFIQLVSGRTPHRPVPWFDKRSEQREPDLPWPEEWARFLSTVRRLGDHDLSMVLGRPPKGDDLKHWLAEDFPEDKSVWTQADFLLIGEFVRLHHGRIAHEIALFGFPGVSGADFPVLEETMPSLANIAGLVARSHSLPLREAASYLAYKHPKELRPRGAFAVYHMALIRVADYLQVESTRAPRILFRLRSPEVPQNWPYHWQMVMACWPTCGVRFSVMASFRLKRGHGERRFDEHVDSQAWIVA